MNKNRSLSGVFLIIVIYTTVLGGGFLHPAALLAQERITLSNRMHLVEKLQDTNVIMQYIHRGKELSQNNNDSAEIVLYTALQNSKRLAFPTGIKQALTALANVYVGAGKYDDAIHLYQTTINYCHDLPALHTALYAMYNNLANVYIKQGHYESALEDYKRAVLAMERYNTQHSGEIYNNLGGLLIQMREYEQVLHYLDKAEAASFQKNDSSNLFSVYGNKGSYFFETGQWDSSVIFSRKALEIAKRLDNKQAIFMSLLNTGELYRRGKKPTEALRYLREAGAVKGQVSPSYKVQLLTVLANTYLDLDQTDLAEKHFREALEDALAQGLNKRAQSAYSGLSKVYETNGNYAKSLEYYKAFRDMEDQIRSEDLSKNISEWELKYRTAEKDKEIIQSKLEISRQQHYLKNKNILIIGISAGALLLALLFVSYFRINRHKRQLQNKQITLLQQQQELEQIKAIIKGEEQERERMARELHDGIGGMLAAIKMNLSAVWERQPANEDKDQLNKVLQMLRNTSTEVRRTAHNLLPDILTQHTLEEALMIYCEHINLSDRLKVEFQYHVPAGKLDKSTELLLYRISQELLQNIIKHAKATTAWLMIKQLNNKLSIIVEDNGAGFNPETASNGYGLMNLEYRVRSLQGTLNIRSDPDRGTTVHIEFDMDKLNTKPVSL